MIKKRIKKIKELVFLIIIRQVYKLLSNLYHMVEEPFLTFKKLIVKDRDKSQIFLIVIIFLMPILAYSVARIIWDYYRFGVIVNEVGIFFSIVSGIEFFLLAYLGYWIIRVMGRK